MRTIGFLVICLAIAALGIYGLYIDARYAATRPPNTPRCGNPAVGAMLMIFPVAPMLGPFGAGVGYIAAILRDAVTSESVPQDRSEELG